MGNHSVARLIFVYNANSGFRNALLDVAHKALSPSTYQCNLCDLTYGVFKEKNAWKKFRQEGKFKLEFLYKDEFKKQYGSKFSYKFDFPIVLAVINEDLQVFISAKELNRLESTKTLIDLMEERGKEI